MDGITRREALVRAGQAALVMGATSAGAVALWDRGRDAPGEPERRPLRRDFRVAPAALDAPELAIVRGDPGAPASTDPALLTRRVVAALGGMTRFVSPGDVVALKPNIGWDRTPAQGANTHPEVMAELVRLAFDAGARRVVVGDFSCNDATRSYQRSGIAKAVAEAGATLVMPDEHRFRTMRVGGELLDEWPIFVPLLEADKIINVPVAKHHGLARLTCALKNWYGLLGGRRDRLHQRIDVSLADLGSFVRPTLTVVDATRVLWRNGPQGGDLGDTRATHTMAASTDQVAADAWAGGLLELRPTDLPYLSLAEKRGLGTTDWRRLRTVELGA